MAHALQNLDSKEIEIATNIWNLVRSLKSSNVELGYYLDGRLFKCCLSAAANP